MSSRQRASLGMIASNLAMTLGAQGDPRMRRMAQDNADLLSKLGEGLTIDEKGRLSVDFSTLSANETRTLMREINNVYRIDRTLNYETTVDNSTTTENDFDAGDIWQTLNNLTQTTIPNIHTRLDALESAGDATPQGWASQDKYNQNEGLSTSYVHYDLGSLVGEYDPENDINYSSANDRVDFSDGVWAVSCDAWGKKTSGSSDSPFYARIYSQDGTLAESSVTVDGSSRDHSMSCHFSGKINASSTTKWLKFAAKKSASGANYVAWVGAHITYTRIG